IPGRQGSARHVRAADVGARQHGSGQIGSLKRRAGEVRPREAYIGQSARSAEPRAREIERALQRRERLTADSGERRAVQLEVTPVREGKRVDGEVRTLQQEAARKIALDDRTDRGDGGPEERIAYVGFLKASAVQMSAEEIRARELRRPSGARELCVV